MDDQILILKDLEAYVERQVLVADVLSEKRASTTRVFGFRHTAAQKKAEPVECEAECPYANDASRDLDEYLKIKDESFSQMLLRKIDELGLSDAECYKRVDIDRRLFSKIRSNSDYKPGKTTAILLAIALHLDLDEALELIGKAGYTLSHSSKFDIIIEFFFVRKIYDLGLINQALYKFDQPLLSVVR